MDKIQPRAGVSPDEMRDAAVFAVGAFLVHVVVLGCLVFLCRRTAREFMALGEASGVGLPVFVLWCVAIVTWGLSFPCLLGSAIADLGILFLSRLYGPKALSWIWFAIVLFGLGILLLALFFSIHIPLGNLQEMISSG